MPDPTCLHCVTGSAADSYTASVGSSPTEGSFIVRLPLSFLLLKGRGAGGEAGFAQAYPMLPSSSGQDSRLSIWRHGFDPRREYWRVYRRYGETTRLATGRVSKTWCRKAWGFDSLSLRLVVPIWKGGRMAKQRFATPWPSGVCGFESRPFRSFHKSIVARLYLQHMLRDSSIGRTTHFECVGWWFDPISLNTLPARRGTACCAHSAQG
jgi:hypothetical protein